MPLINLSNLEIEKENFNMIIINRKSQNTVRVLLSRISFKYLQIKQIKLFLILHVLDKFRVKNNFKKNIKKIRLKTRRAEFQLKYLILYKKVDLLKISYQTDVSIKNFWRYRLSYFTYHIAVISHKNKNFCLKHLKKKSSFSKYTPFFNTN